MLDNEIFRPSGSADPRLDGLAIGGLSSGYKRPKRAYRTPPAPDASFLAGFAREPGYRILLCHHPEYWERFVRETGVELTVSGHAHGGQWGFFGRGVWAPGQGLFPRYVSGLYGGDDAVLAVSRGMTNSVPAIPRFFNPCEILVLKLGEEGKP